MVEIVTVHWSYFSDNYRDAHFSATHVPTNLPGTYLMISWLTIQHISHDTIGSVGSDVRVARSLFTMKCFEDCRLSFC